jgi:hypothetical protein
MAAAPPGSATFSRKGRRKGRPDFTNLDRLNRHFGRSSHFTSFTNLQRLPVKRNTGFPLFYRLSLEFIRPISHRNVNQVTGKPPRIHDEWRFSTNVFQ